MARKFVSPLWALLLGLTVSCSGLDYEDPHAIDVPMGSSGETGEFVIDMLNRGDQLPGGHLTGDLPMEEVNLPQAEQALVDEWCGACHTLNRVYATRGPRKLWVDLLNRTEHLEADVPAEVKEKLLDVFETHFAH